MKKQLIIVALILSSMNASAFIAPLGYVVKDAFEGRKSGNAIELSMHHHIEVRLNEFVDVDERVLMDRGQIRVLWTSPSFGQAVAASFSNFNYVAQDKTFPTRSILFLKSLLFASADDFRNAMISEQFARADQFQQYKAGNNMNGDPQTWDMKQVYVAHPDIFLSRTASGASVAVIGIDDTSMQKTIFFDRGHPGVSRLQWKDRGQLVFWDFEQFVKNSDGTIPKKALFEVGGKTVVTTTISYRRIDSERQAAELRQVWSRGRSIPVSANAESALRVLLSYR